jgi:DNA polymerase III alpha subunit (gram-positive type)
MKAFYFDVETTGLDPRVDSILKLAYIIEVDHVIVEEGVLCMKPIDYTTIKENGLLESRLRESSKVNGISIEDIEGFESDVEAFVKLRILLDKYIDKYDKGDKMHPIGYNVSFDLNFLYQWASARQFKYLGSYLNHRYIDVMKLVDYLAFRGKLFLADHKLETVCKHFKIPIKAHDPAEDIRATRALLQQISRVLKYQEVEAEEKCNQK